MKTVTRIIVLFIFFYSPKLPAQDFTIAAAADLRYALKEIVQQYKQAYHYSGNISLIFGSSGSLFQQIMQNAPFDIFFCADNTFPAKLHQEGKTAAAPVQYARGYLVLWSAKKDISKGISVLQNPDILKIAIANPEVAPYGKRAVECLRYYRMFDKVEQKLVRGENVSQTAQFVLTGNADLGFIALSLALSPEMASKGRFYPLDEKSYTPLDQSFVVLKSAENNQGVISFTQFLQTKPARDIFNRYGFTVPLNR